MTGFASNVRATFAVLALLLAAPFATAQSLVELGLFTTGDNISSVYYGPDGFVYVVEHNSQKLAKYQADGTFVEDALTGVGNFSDYLILPNGNHVIGRLNPAVQNALVDPTYGMALKNADGGVIGASPISLTLLPSGNFIASFAHTTYAGTNEYDQDGNFVRTIFPSEGGQVTVLRNGQILYYNSGAQSVKLFNADLTLAASAYVPTVLGATGGVTETWDGMLLVATNAGIQAFDASLTPLGIVSTLQANGFTNMPDGRLLVGESGYPVNGNGRVLLFEVNGGMTGSLTAMPGAPLYWPLDTATLSLDADGRVTGLYGLRADLGFDTGRLDYDANSLAAGSAFASGSPQVFESAFEADGRVELTAGRTDGNGISAGGSVAAMTFSVVDHAAPGDAAFTLSGVDPIDASGAAFTIHEANGGSFVVGGVWPGDHDNNCTVQALDLLPVAFNYDATGPARLGDRDLTWGAKAFSPWGGSSASTDFAQSFADSDGNGEVDASDVLALLVNYGETHDASTGCTPPAAPLTKTATPVTIALDGAVGQLVEFEIAITEEATDLIGTASLMNHISTGATIVSVEPGELFQGAMSVVMLNGQPADVAFAHRGASAAVSGTGTLFRVVARIDAPNASVQLSDLHMATAAGGTISVDPSSGGIAVSPAVVVANEGGPEASLDVVVTPNPARGAAALLLTTPEAGEVTVRMFDMLGRKVSDVTARVVPGTSEIALPVAELAPGAYVVRAEGAFGVVTRRLTVAR